jgi:uncharacterized protein YfaS (alpha-2-macroglobulin family)
MPSRSSFLLRSVLAAASVAASVAVLGGCAGRGEGRPVKAPDPARVEAHSAGLLPSGAAIKVVLSRAAAGAVTGGALTEGAAAEEAAGAEAPAALFRLYPAVAGKARWEDERTVSFYPDKPLKEGRSYRVEFDLGLAGGQAAGGDDYFSFELRAGGQRVSLEASPPSVGIDGRLSVEGSLVLAQGVSDAAAEKALSASEGSVLWSHEGERLHRFTVSGIAPSKRQRELVLGWKGASLGAGKSGEARVRLPSASAFALLSASPLGAGAASGAASGGAKGVELAFSKALDKAQDLRGLVSVDGVEDLRYTVTGSTLSLYADAWPASAKVRVGKGLKDASGAYFATEASATVAFDWEKPQARFLTKGTILPTSQGLVLPIETMNLSGVIVEALEVYGDNMLQFLQVNDLDSSREMKRVGEVVWRKRFDLGYKDDWKNRWVRQGLDLGPLLDERKDGMFQIRITFRKDDIRYVCPKSHDFKDLRFPDAAVLDRDDDEYSMWSYVEEWANGYDDYYEYEDDPCHPAYYLPSYDHDITIRRNVVVSDVGASIARASDGSWHVAASDLRSAKPLPGAKVSLFSYQRRLLASGLTGSSGLLVLKAEGEPVFATVASGSQTSYLKVDSGSTLSIGHFDVGGEKADSGLKGFIYGERGVWRPGDPIHLSFILYDGSGKLPAAYPVSFELEDPLGRVVRTGTYADSVGGFYAIDSSTGQDAPTGTYIARVKAGGRTFAKSLKVETIQPNRLKLDLSWEGAPPVGASYAGASPYLASDTDRMRLAAAWLTGAKAGALKADVSATFSRAVTSFTTLPDYTFDDPTRTVSSERLVLFNDRLGSDGKAEFPVELGGGAAQGSSSSLPPGKLKANILTRVFENSGIFSSESTSVDFHPYERYLGLRLPNGDAARGMLLVDKDQRVDIALVDREGRPVSGAAGSKVEVGLYQLEWRWWWEKGDESLAMRADELFERPVKKDTVTLGADGRGSWTFQVKYPSWGRYLVRVRDLSSKAGSRGGHAAGKIVYIDWPGWAGRGRDSGGAEAMLELSPGSAKYAPGDKASVSFPSNDLGGALVRVERSGRVLREEWIKTKKETTAYEFPVTPDMAPNVYIHVTFVQPHLQTANDLPIRLYGVVPVMVEDPSTRLKPLIETAASLSPGTEASFTVREEKGRPMTYTVAVVDEGLLGITRYQTPDPWNEFYKKEASALSSWDLYQYVMGAYSGKLETLLAVGGSDDALGGGSRKPSRFPAVVYAFPPRELKAGETARQSFKLGPYIGALRFMVVAGSLPRNGAPGAAFGVAERSVPVRADLMAQLTAPRVLSPGDEASIPATVFGFMGAKTANLRLEASGALSLVGPGAKSLDFKADGELSATFTIKAADSPGRGRLRLVATMGGKSSEQSIDLEVRAVGASVTSVTASDVGPLSAWKAPIELPGEAGSNSLSIELSRLRPIDLASRVDYLVSYPHGCAEQTTSAAFPQLYLPKAVSLSAESADRARDNVAVAIEKLRGFQTTRGGFSMWPGGGLEDAWVSAYATHFLLAAKAEGFDVPQGLLDGALGFVEREARSWNSSEPWSQSTQAYRLYDLALARRPEIAAMNRFRDFPAIPTAARFRLAAAYAMSGMREAADSLTRGLSSEVSDYAGLAENTYGSSLRELAVVLDALNALGDGARALPVYNKLAESLGSKRWLSTQDLGVALGAALPYAMLASSAEAPALRISLVDASGARLGAEISARLDKPIARVDVDERLEKAAAISIRNEGSSPVFARLVAKGIPAAGRERAISNGLSLSLRYLGMDGKPIDPAKAQSGSDLVVEATVRNRAGRALKDLALTQLLPAGWEIANYRVGSELPIPSKEKEEASPRPERKAGPLYDYQDIRDDSVRTYFSLGEKESKTFRIYATKAYEGSFYLPAASVSAMYDEERCQALVPGKRLERTGGD